MLQILWTQNKILELKFNTCEQWITLDCSNFYTVDDDAQITFRDIVKICVKRSNMYMKQPQY